MGKHNLGTKVLSLLHLHYQSASCLSHHSLMLHTGDGCIAVGAQNGQVRMYSGKNIVPSYKLALCV